MATRGRSIDRAATRRRTAQSLGLLLVVSGTALAGAHGMPTAPPRTTGPAEGSALTRTVASAVTIPLPEDSAVVFSRWATALTPEHQPGVGRPFRATPPIPTAVPPVADVAYRRAALVLAGEAPSCALDWSLLAAIGHVESDHGRRNATLGADGVSRPGVVGPTIDVPGRRSPLPDTDAGDLDGTGTEDRAVGALQLLPSTWSAAAVDGDADGLRNPQDIDDAALAAGVLLCTSSPGLGSEAGLRQALRHYNPTRGYVDAVQRLAAAYAVTEAVTAVVTAVVDVVAGPARLPGSTGPDAAAAATPTPVETPSARETVPTSAGTVSASSLPSAEGAEPGGPGLPSPVVAADATEVVSSSGNAPAPTTRPPGTPEPTPASEPEPEPEADPAPEPTPDPRPEPGPDLTDQPAPEPAASSEPTTPAPAPTPEQGAGDAAAPTTSPTPDIQTVRGLWTLDGASTFLLDGVTVVDVDALGDLTAAAPLDLDGDGAGETLGEELTGLAGSTVEVRGTTTPDRVAIRSLDDLRVVAP